MIIWVIGRNYPLPENNMQGLFELEQAKMLARFGNEVHYLTCCLHPIKKIKSRGFQSWNDGDVRVSTLSAFYPPRVSMLYFVRGRNRYWKQLFAKVENESGIPDVIHLHYPSMLMIADALEKYKDRGTRIVATEHWSKVLEGKIDRAELNEFRKYTAIIDQIICVGTPLKNAVREQIGMEGVVVPNVVNTLFCPSEEKHEGFRYIAVGRLVKQKQFDRIVEAFADCFSGEKHITLTIIGDGKQKDILKKIIDERDVGDQVRLMGNMDRKTTAEIVGNSDCLICFSSLETFGVPVIEAWACGLPVIASTAVAAVDKIDEHLGTEVSYEDFEGLKDKMKFVYEHRNCYDKSFISNYAKTHFSEETIYNQLMETYFD